MTNNRKELEDKSLENIGIRVEPPSVYKFPNGNPRLPEQGDWIDYFNCQKGEIEGKKMMSASDLYRAGQIWSDKSLQCLREEFKYRRTLITSTRSCYDLHSFGARIIQDFGSMVPGVKPVEERVDYVPHFDYDGEKIKWVINISHIAFIRALFNTKDDSKKISETLERLTQDEIENIWIYTPRSWESRKPEYAGNSAATFLYGNAKFIIRCDSRGAGVDGAFARGIPICADTNEGGNKK